MRCFLRLAGVLMFLTSSVVSAQTVHDFTVDLADQKAGSTRTAPIDAGENFRVFVINHTAAAYDIKSEKLVVPIPALPAIPAGAPPVPCKSLGSTFHQAFSQLKTETDVAALIASSRQGATPCSVDERTALDETIKMDTTTVLGPFQLQSSEELRVTISRKDDKAVLTWVFIASTGAPGEWRLSYGFNFLPSRDDRFYLAPSDDGKKFTITSLRHRDRFVFAPSVYFSFLTTSEQRRTWTIGPVVGLGFDTITPIVFVGGTIAFRQNISLNLGMVMHQEKRLNGKYAAGSTVTDNLTDDQLYEKTYVPRLFVGVGFRFDENPFKKKDAGK